MTKSYIEELAAWVSKRKASRPRQDKNTVAFLAVKNDIKDAIDAGYSMKTIWEHLRDLRRIEYRYETFTLHVKRHIKAKPPPAGDYKSTPRTKEIKDKKEPKKTAPILGGFTFNSTPKKEDLI